ncbi:MAG: hypothetical protein ACLVB5_02360 [Christensenellales bacterium]
MRRRVARSLFPVTGRTHQLRVRCGAYRPSDARRHAYCTAESARLAAKYRAPYHQLSAVRLSLSPSRHPGRALQIDCPPDFCVDILSHL